MLADDQMQNILEVLRSHTGHDFSNYKSSTIRRRILRRLSVHQITQPRDYVRYLQENAPEIDLLFQEMLISVTSFFRDPDVWKSLAAGPLPELIQSRPAEDALRAWVPGCATGEEVYTLAMVIRESLDKLGQPRNVQIFGTDLDSRAIDIARASNYLMRISADISPERLQRFFTCDEKRYRVSKPIREMAIFALQNMIKHPPFTNLDIISCRNVLIYLDAELQRRLLPIFHYALKPGGLLILGSSETIGAFTNLFEPVNLHWRIYRRQETFAALQSIPEMPAEKRREFTMPRTETDDWPKLGDKRITALIERWALARFSPTFVVVNDRGDLIHVHGRTGEFLELSQGQVRTNVLDMAREGLKHELNALIRQAISNETEQVRDGIRVKTNGDYAHVSVTAARLFGPESIRGLILLTFRSVAEVAKTSDLQSESPRDLVAVDRPADESLAIHVTGDSDAIESLRRELQYMKVTHQATLDDLETSNQELKSANEELQSINEEMQSTGEELESSKEELQSLNEEMAAVNEELQSRIDELSQANDDLQNLFNSTDIATVYLDDELNIKRFTVQATEIIALRHSDLGRPFADLTTRLRYQKLASDCQRVLDTLEICKTEVQSEAGNWYLMRILPYRTVDNVIDGLVLTFVNIDEFKLAKESSRLRAYFESIFDTVRQPLLILDEAGMIASANRYFYGMFKLTKAEVRGHSLYELSDGVWNTPELRELLNDILPQDTTFDGFKVDRKFPGVGRRVLMLNARRLEDVDALAGRILLVMEDVTSRETINE